MKKAIVNSEYEYFRYKVDELKKILLPISAIFTSGNLLIEAAFTFRPGVTKTERVGAFMQANVTHIKMYKEYKYININRAGGEFKVVYWMPFEKSAWEGSVGESYIVTAMYELAQQERCN